MKKIALGEEERMFKTPNKPSGPSDGQATIKVGA